MDRVPQMPSLRLTRYTERKMHTVKDYRQNVNGVLSNQCIWTELCIPVKLLKAYEIQTNDFVEMEKSQEWGRGKRWMEVQDYTTAKKHHNVKGGFASFLRLLIYIWIFSCALETVVKTNPKALIHTASTWCNSHAVNDSILLCLCECLAALQALIFSLIMYLFFACIAWIWASAKLSGI